MSVAPQQVTNRVLMTLRKIIRAIDMHSRYLVAQHDLTGPQAIILSEILQRGGITGAELAKQVHLSKGTISGILARLESKGLITRLRDEGDRRRFWLQATPKAEQLLAQAPPLLQQSFVQKFNALAEHEQLGILTTLLHISDMMGADSLEAAQLLSTTPLLVEVSRSEAIEGIRMDKEEPPTIEEEWE
ncbi:transcriptional regulator, TrmB [Magnetococcus marinus MC-1]|uniref:Transcriptional regulator, TrmB n=1 Tax=Magnetococcus marinus (strain ATCC BAA-1437 / JCM 17883 / MC-1) TaxID=156889 RepID=A0L449_MAGMM|nr:MarR family transcriptional regulator [Magnetococcus marinus]ABK42742.1 transcriptional regulator, TrmB [Magnetococcus marinus MC-1]